MEHSTREAKSLYELYQHLGLSVDLIQPAKGMAILNLKDMDFKLPYQSPSFRPDYYSFLFVKKGQGQYTIDAHTFTAGPNTIYFTNPSNYRTFRWEKIEEVYLLSFDESFLKTYVHKDIFSVFPFLLTETFPPQRVDAAFFTDIEKIYLTIHKEYIHRTTDKCEIMGHLLAVLLYNIKDYFWQNYNPVYEGNRSSQIVKQFKQMLEKHYRDLQNGTLETAFRVQDYADAQNIHPNYLNNVIKTKTGKSVTTWIADKTIAEAKSLLQNTSISIKTISYKLGFSETAHFSNYLKKHTHISPIQYRKQAEGNR